MGGHVKKALMFGCLWLLFNNLAFQKSWHGWSTLTGLWLDSRQWEKKLKKWLLCICVLQGRQGAFIKTSLFEHESHRPLCMDATWGTSISPEVFEANAAKGRPSRSCFFFHLFSGRASVVVLVWSLFVNSVVNSETVGCRLLSVYGACDCHRLSQSNDDLQGQMARRRNTAMIFMNNCKALLTRLSTRYK